MGNKKHERDDRFASPAEKAWARLEDPCDRCTCNCHLSARVACNPAPFFFRFAQTVGKLARWGRHPIGRFLFAWATLILLSLSFFCSRNEHTRVPWPNRNERNSPEKKQCSIRTPITIKTQQPCYISPLSTSMLTEGTEQPSFIAICDPDGCSLIPPAGSLHETHLNTSSTQQSKAKQSNKRRKEERGKRRVLTISLREWVSRRCLGTNRMGLRRHRLPKGEANLKFSLNADSRYHGIAAYQKNNKKSCGGYMPSKDKVISLSLSTAPRAEPKAPSMGPYFVHWLKANGTRIREKSTCPPWREAWSTPAMKTLFLHFSLPFSFCCLLPFHLCTISSPPPLYIHHPLTNPIHPSLPPDPHNTQYLQTHIHSTRFHKHILEIIHRKKHIQIWTGYINIDSHSRSAHTHWGSSTHTPTTSHFLYKYFHNGKTRSTKVNTSHFVNKYIHNGQTRIIRVNTSLYKVWGQQRWLRRQFTNRRGASNCNK